MSNKGDKGQRGMIAFCPVCGSSSEKITWDPKTDTCTCACGWSDDPDRKKQIEEMASIIYRSGLSFKHQAEALYNAGYRKQKEDTVEVVRCKDCKFNVANMEKDPLDITDYSGDDIVCSYFMTDGLEPADFCSCGEAKMKGSESIANKATTTGKWISVEERLPDNYRAVLVVCEYTMIGGGARIIVIGSYGGGFWSLADADGTRHLTKYMHAVVTHWMPLPEAPKMTRKEDEGK